MTIAEGCTIFFKWNNKVATVAALLGIEESRTLWAVWGTTQLHIGGYRSVRSGEWLVPFRSSSSDNPWTSLVNHPCLCLIAPISQHIMLPPSTVATALNFNWFDTRTDGQTGKQLSLRIMVMAQLYFFSYIQIYISNTALFTLI